MTLFSRLPLPDPGPTGRSGLLGSARAVVLLALLWGAGYTLLLAAVGLVAGIALALGLGPASLRDARDLVSYLLPGALKMGVLSGATFGLGLRVIGQADEEGFLAQWSAGRAVLLGSPIMAIVAILLMTGGRGLTVGEVFNVWMIVTAPALVLSELTLKLISHGREARPLGSAGAPDSVIDSRDNPVVDASPETTVSAQRLRDRNGSAEL